MAETKSRKKNKPIAYFYNPFYRGKEHLAFVEVWQVLDDEVLGELYPWQYGPTAELSNRIIKLNAYALRHFDNEGKGYPNERFIYKLSAKLLEENRVHKLGTLLQPNLVLCFDIYELEKFGDKDSLAGLSYLRNLGATIMLSGVDRAPLDILIKYTAEYFLLDYRYYNELNKGLIKIIKQLADMNGVVLVVKNVNNTDMVEFFTKEGIEIFSGSALNKPKKKLNALLKEVEMIENEDILPLDKEIKKKFLVAADKERPQEESLDLSVFDKKDLNETIINLKIPQEKKEPINPSKEPITPHKEKVVPPQTTLPITQEKEKATFVSKNKIVVADAPRPNKGQSNRRADALDNSAKDKGTPITYTEKQKTPPKAKNAAIIVAPEARPSKRKK